MSGPYYISAGGNPVLQGGSPVLITQQEYEACCCQVGDCSFPVNIYWSGYVRVDSTEWNGGTLYVPSADVTYYNPASPTRPRTQWRISSPAPYTVLIVFVGAYGSLSVEASKVAPDTSACGYYTITEQPGGYPTYYVSAIYVLSA